MFFIFAGGYLVLAAWLYVYSLRWAGDVLGFFKRIPGRIIYGIFYWFIAISMILAYFSPAGPIKDFWMILRNSWLGFAAYAVQIWIFLRILQWILIRTKKLTKEKTRYRTYRILFGLILVISAAVINLYGMIHARQTETEYYQVSIEKDGGNLENLRIAMVADLHLGYNIGYSEIQTMVNIINEENVDIVLICGDIFDNDFDAISNPEGIRDLLRSIESRYGVYACYGNHDVAESTLGGFTLENKNIPKTSDARMDAFLQDAGIQLLQDESVWIDNSFYLVGRRDYSSEEKSKEIRKTPQELLEYLDHSKPIIVMDHQPRELQELSDAGADLDLCGHTHDGQIFPGNLFIGFAWENACGYMQKGDMHNIVTSGLGLWGPNLRVGTNSEVCIIDVNFE